MRLPERLLTDAEYAEAIRVLAAELDHDPECMHMVADNILLHCLRRAGYPQLAEAFDKLEKWYT